MSEVSALLDSPEYREALAEISRRAHVRLDPDYTPGLQAMDEGDVALSGVPVAALRDVLESDRAAVVRFSLERLRKYYGVAMEEEYPPGEEPGEDDRPTVVRSHGIGRGFLLLTLVDYYILRDRPSELDPFLKARRIPKAKQYAADLRVLFNAARQQQPG